MKCLKLFFALAVIIMSWSQGATARDCANPQTQLDMNFCAKARYEKAAGELEEMYKKIHARLSSANRAALEKSQVSWEAYKKDQCAAEMLIYKGGSIVPLVEFSCLEKLTKNRMDVLKSAYEN